MIKLKNVNVGRKNLAAVVSAFIAMVISVLAIVKPEWAAVATTNPETVAAIGTAITGLLFALAGNVDEGEDGAQEELLSDPVPEVRGELG